MQKARIARLALRLAQHHRRGDFFAPGGMRHAEGDRFGHGGMREQHFVDFARRNFFAAAIDQFLDAAGQREIAVGIEKALIAGAEPAVGEGLRVGFGIIFVAGDHVRSLNDHFAALAGGR